MVSRQPPYALSLFLCPQNHSISGWPCALAKDMSSSFPLSFPPMTLAYGPQSVPGGPFYPHLPLVPPVSYPRDPARLRVIFDVYFVQPFSNVVRCPFVGSFRAVHCELVRPFGSTPHGRRQFFFLIKILCAPLVRFSFPVYHLRWRCAEGLFHLVPPARRCPERSGFLYRLAGRDRPFSLVPSPTFKSVAPSVSTPGPCVPFVRARRLKERYIARGYHSRSLIPTTENGDPFNWYKAGLFFNFSAGDGEIFRLVGCVSVQMLPLSSLYFPLLC